MSAETERIFQEIIEPYELGVCGLEEYDLVERELVGVHQSNFLRHLAALTGDGKTDMSDLTDDVVHELQRRVWYDFVMFKAFDVGDIILASQGGLALLVDDEVGHRPLLLDGGSRVHGRLVRPVALPVPVLDTVLVDETTGQLDHSAIVEQAAVALELESASVEVAGRFSTPANQDAAVLLPLSYSQMQIKKRLE